MQRGHGNNILINVALLFINKVPANLRDKFESEIIAICNGLNIRNPNWLMVLINIESAGTFSPSVYNKLAEKANGQYKGATGLIQFIPSTAKWLGTSIPELRAMTHVQQLYYVGLYLARVKADVGAKSINNFTELYEMVFQPAGFGKPDSHIVGKKGGQAYNHNYPIDTKYGNNDGVLTMGDFRAYAAKIYSLQTGGALPGWNKSPVSNPTQTTKNAKTKTEAEKLKSATGWLIAGTVVAVVVGVIASANTQPPPPPRFRRPQPRPYYY